MDLSQGPTAHSLGARRRELHSGQSCSLCEQLNTPQPGQRGQKSSLITQLGLCAGRDVWRGAGHTCPRCGFALGSWQCFSCRIFLLFLCINNLGFSALMELWNHLGWKIHGVQPFFSTAQATSALCPQVPPPQGCKSPQGWGLHLCVLWVLLPRPGASRAAGDP